MILDDWVFQKVRLSSLYGQRKAIPPCPCTFTPPLFAHDVFVDRRDPRFIDTVVQGGQRNFDSGGNQATRSFTKHRQKVSFNWFEKSVQATLFRWSPLRIFCFLRLTIVAWHIRVLTLLSGVRCLCSVSSGCLMGWLRTRDRFHFLIRKEVASVP